MDEVLQTIDILKKKLYLLEFKKIISFSYKEDLVSRCVYIDIKVDNFVYRVRLGSEFALPMSAFC